MPGCDHQKRMASACRKFDAYLQVRNQICPSRLSWNIAKILQTYYFGNFGHGSVHPPKTINSPWRKLWCFSKCLKSTRSLTFFLRYYNLKNSTTWLVTSILAHDFRKEFCQIKDSRWNINSWCGAVARSYFMRRSFFSLGWQSLYSLHRGKKHWCADLCKLVALTIVFIAISLLFTKSS